MPISLGEDISLGEEETSWTLSQNGHRMDHPSNMAANSMPCMQLAGPQPHVRSHHQLTEVSKSFKSRLLSFNNSQLLHLLRPLS